MARAPIDKCNHCGSDEGFYSKDFIAGSSRYFHNFDGSEAENAEFYEYLSHKQGKHAYCNSCNKRLFKMSDIVVDDS